MTEKKPTLSAQRRFEAINEMLPATLHIGETEGDEGKKQAIEGTLVDVSSGCMSVRIPLDKQEANLLNAIEEGHFLEVELEQAENHRWTVLGHVAWLWVPSMSGDDTIGSAGINIAGVIEDDRRFIGKLRNVFGQGKPVEVAKSPLNYESPAKRRAREQAEKKKKAAKGAEEET